MQEMNKDPYSQGKSKAVFLDRDGTINVEVHLLHKIEQVRIIKNAAEGIKILNEADYKVMILTNQPVVARNLCSEKDVREINEEIVRRLAKKGARIDAVYYCPHHPDRGFPGENPAYKIKCDCRKPGIGMFKQAIAEHNIDPARSYCVGDTTTDILAGKNAGCSTILVQTGYGGKDRKFDVSPDIVCRDLYAAARFIAKDN